MDLLVDILSRIRREGAMFYGLSVKEHLGYIKGLYDTFEEQYLMVSRLREKVQCNQAETITEIESELRRLFIKLLPDSPHSFVNHKEDPSERLPQIYTAYDELKGLLKDSGDVEKDREIEGIINNLPILFKQLEEVLSFEMELGVETIHLKSLSEIYVDNILDSMMINWSGTQADCRRIIEFLLQNNYITSDLSTDSFISDHFMFNGKKKTKDDVRKFPRGDADGISILDENFSLKIPIR